MKWPFKTTQLWTTTTEGIDQLEVIIIQVFIQVDKKKFRPRKENTNTPPCWFLRSQLHNLVQESNRAPIDKTIHQCFKKEPPRCLTIWWKWAIKITLDRGRTSCLSKSSQVIPQWGETRQFSIKDRNHNHQRFYYLHASSINQFKTMFLAK